MGEATAPPTKVMFRPALSSMEFDLLRRRWQERKAMSLFQQTTGFEEGYLAPATPACCLPKQNCNTSGTTPCLTEGHTVHRNRAHRGMRKGVYTITGHEPAQKKQHQVRNKLGAPGAACHILVRGAPSSSGSTAPIGLDLSLIHKLASIYGCGEFKKPEFQNELALVSGSIKSKPARPLLLNFEPHPYITETNQAIVYNEYPWLTPTTTSKPQPNSLKKGLLRIHGSDESGSVGFSQESCHQL